jgi:hypothetical protein
MTRVVLAVAHRFAWQLHAYAIITDRFNLVLTTLQGNLG